MKFGRITRLLLVLTGATLSMLLGACRDGGLLEPPNPSDSCCGRVVVSVTVSKTTLPLGGVEVLLRKQGQLVKRAETGQDGKAVFTGVCAGVYDLRVAKEGYQVAERGEITIDGCDTVNTGFGLLTSGSDPADSCCHGRLYVAPKDASTGALLGGAIVKLWKGGVIKETVTVQDRAAAFDGLCPGAYAVSIHREGYRVVEFEFEIGCSGEVERAVPMTRSENSDSCCHGRAFIAPKDAATGELLNGAIVKLWKGGVLKGTQTVQGRAAAFDGLCPGTYGVSIAREGYRAIEFQFEIGCNGEVERGVSMTRAETGDTCCHGKLFVAPKGPDGALLNGAVVKLWQGGRIIQTATVQGRPAGFDGLCAGAYGVSVHLEGYKVTEFEFRLTCNETIERVVTLQRMEQDTCCNASFRFVVKGPASGQDGVPLAGVRVTVGFGGGLIADGTTNSNGVVEFDGICNKRVYGITFSKDGYARKAIEINVVECKQYGETIFLAR